MRINLNLILQHYRNQIPNEIDVKTGNNCFIVKINYGLLNKTMNLNFRGYRSGNIIFTTDLGLLKLFLPLVRNKIPSYVNIEGGEISISLYELVGPDLSAIIDALEFNNLWIENGCLMID